MTDNTLTIYQADDLQKIIDMVLNSLDSPNTKRNYRRSLTDFFAWYQAQGRPGLTKATIQAYRATLQESGSLKAQSINLKMAAIRKLINEALDNGLIDPVAAAGILRIKSLSQHGRRSGYWLNQSQARALLNAPDTNTFKGLRDKAILAVMIGAGLRRSEVVKLRLEHLQKRDGRWVIVDIVGKGNRVRSVPISVWCKAAIDDWLNVFGIKSGYVFCSLDRCLIKAGQIRRLTPEALYFIIDKYGHSIGIDLACHDMRRSFAKLSYQGGSPVEQIQKSLGHASTTTTERYLGVEQSFTDAPCDHIIL